MDAIAEARLQLAKETWRTADLDSLRIRYAALLLSVADHRTAMRHQGTAADKRLWSVLDKEMF